ncbi:hypothetical protein GX50_08368 [[Emmonsia] crescens]|uniref:F-box domain-containing protein n=1 Tax=[Emmonsia] crescens TaxID=73230 RepID=A0A2B7Z630_9EURO|nr:hypothetical protein GX50_08368 [Emmonsia crescens]
METNGTAVPGFRSERQRDEDIIRVASYYRRDFDLAVTQIDPHEHKGIRNSVAHPFVSSPSAALGSLEVLPLEILQEIFLLLDIKSLFQVRDVNLRAREVIYTLRGYKSIMSYAFEPLCVILRTKIASWFTIHDLYNVLCTRDCHICDSFSGFIFLPSFQRCCFPCLKTAYQFRVVSLTEAGKRFKLSKQALRNSFPILSTIPGQYSMEEVPYKRRMYLLAEEQLIKVFECSNRDRETRISPDTPRKDVLRYMAATTLPCLDTATGHIEHGICCAGCQIKLEKSFFSTGPEYDSHVVRDRIYSQAGFLEHFPACSEARILWESSQEGRIPVKVPYSIQRRRCFNNRSTVTSTKRQYQY